MMKKLLDCAAVCLWSLTVHAAPVTVSHGYFDITFYNAGDTNGYLTGQQNWTAQQIADVAASVDTWAGNITNTAGRQIQMHVFWEEMNDSGANVLGGSGSNRVVDGSAAWNLAEYVWREGSDYSPFDFDTIISYDITAGGLSWNFGEGTPAGDEIDFRSVLTHELGHSLGFSTAYDYSFDRWGVWVAGWHQYAGITAWDRNLVDSAGNKPLNATTGYPGNFNQYNNPVYWDGAAATALYGDLVPIYAPVSWQSGSSLSHLDEGLLGAYLMSPSIGPGQTARAVSDLEWAMMTDMGWDVVPEPTTVLLLGLGGVVLRQRKR